MESVEQTFGQANDVLGSLWSWTFLLRMVAEGGFRKPLLPISPAFSTTDPHISATSLLVKALNMGSVNGGWDCCRNMKSCSLTHGITLRRVFILLFLFFLSVVFEGVSLKDDDAPNNSEF